jgi:hypothetical protein
VGGRLSMFVGLWRWNAKLYFIDNGNSHRNNRLKGTQRGNK